ncbi:hypothetical protein F4810DRAFT_532194 [Camillea tinctor]|nr:hypothetical protein F4810DRAFT_532194 [Camillea tinctor]
MAAEVIGLVGSITGLIDITGRLIKKCYTYIGSVRGAPDDIRRIRDMASSFQLEIQGLKCFITTHPDGADLLLHLAKPDGALTQAFESIRDLLKLLGPEDSSEELDSSHVVRGMARLSIEDLKWPFKARQAESLLARLEAHKSSLTLALNAGLARNVEVIKVDIQDVKTKIQENNASLEGIERRNMLNWLCPKGEAMRRMHADKRELQEPNTCSWMTREDAWKQWLNRQALPNKSRRFIWIHGIPGAGKTVLASYLIEQAASACQARGYAYYYCLHSRNQDETIPMLKWVVTSLSKRAGLIPTKIQEAYKSESVLSILDLLDCLEEISHQFNQVYIIVDAVDESQPRDVLLKTLSEIGTSERFCNVSLLFTSREENDIAETIKDLRGNCSEISMSNINVRDDIKSFVRAELKRDRAWRRWDPGFLNDIEDRLVQEARGMFRWAVCQLDVLKNQRNKEGILEALRTLPKDIFATYERILTNIPERDKEFARTALALICSSTSEIPTAEILVAACLYNVPYGDIGNYTVETLQDICGCLIHVTKLRAVPATYFNRLNEDAGFHQVALAHYTVKEYLFYPGTAEGPAKFFALSSKDVRNTDLMVIFNGLRHLNRPGTNANGPISRYEEYCLEMTEKALKHRRTDILGNEVLRSAVIDSLAPEFRHQVCLRQLNGVTRIMRNHFPIWFTLISWEIFATSKITGTLGNIILVDWLDLAEQYLETSGIKEMRRDEAVKVWTTPLKLKNEPVGTLLDLCVRRRKQKYLHLFVRFGATFEYENGVLYTCMNALRGHDPNGNRTNALLRLLLGACANPNPIPDQGASDPKVTTRGHKRTGFIFTPLQYAVYNLESSWVETLLEECADANGRGDKDGVLPSTFNDISSGKVDYFQKLGQQHTLEVCATTTPPWATSDPNSEHVKKARQTIEGLLKRYGATQENKDDGPVMVIDIVDEVDEDDKAQLDDPDSGTD